MERKEKFWALLNILEERFNKNLHRHPNVTWKLIKRKLEDDLNALSALECMENTGGEPDVIQFETQLDNIFYIDCSKESPIGRRSLCYDQAALINRKKFPPMDSAMNLAKTMGISLLDEELYRALNKVESFDLKSQSWVKTPLDIRKKGGAIFCDYRYGHVFTYHNSAESYYKSRGFRGYIII